MPTLINKVRVNHDAMVRETFSGKRELGVETVFRTPASRAFSFAKVSAKLNFDLAGVGA